MKKVKTPFVIDEKKVLAFAKQGKRDKHWYKETRQTLIEIFGEEDLWLVCQLLAATSMNSTLKSNITLFRKAYHQIKHDKELKGFVPVMLGQLERVKVGNDLSGRKISSFAKAMFGDINAVVVDMWLLRAFGLDTYRTFRGRPKGASADKRRYDFIESWVRKRAKKMKIKPCELSSMIWAGTRNHFTGAKTTSNPTRYCDFLKDRFSLGLFANINNEYQKAVNA